MEDDMQKFEKGLVALDQYESGPRADDNASLRELDRSLGAIGPELVRLDTEHQTHLSATKGRFNVFTVLRGARKEAGLHTPWFAYLLDPKEKHDCDDMFLKLFLKGISTCVQPHDDASALLPPAGLDLVDTADAKIILERRIDGDQPDIMINLPRWGGIIVENKIDAGEQPRQMARYAELLSKDFPHKKTLLLYLTPDGRSSNTAEGEAYFRISYSKHILKWLDECLHETYLYVNINQALQQYRNVVHQLTGVSPMENEYMEKIISLVEKYPAVIRHVRSVDAAVEKLRQKYWDDFFDLLRTEISKGPRNAQMINQITYKKGYPSTVINYADHSIGTMAFQFTLEFCGADRVPAGKDLYIGLTKDSPWPSEIVTQFYNEMIRRFDSPRIWKQGDLWLGGYYLTHPDFSDAGLAALIQRRQEKLENAATATASEVCRYIDAAEEVLKKIVENPSQN